MNLQQTLTVLTVLTLPLSLSAQTHLDIAIPAREEGGFHGPVKKVVTEYNYNMSDRKYKEVRLYDEAGNLLSRTDQNSKGEILYFATNTFSSAGCLINQRVEDVRAKTTNDYEVVINLPTRKMAYRDRISGDVEILEYNEGRHRTSVMIIKKGKKPLPYSAYKRKPNQEKLLYTKYNEKGRVRYTVAYEWNDRKLRSRTLITDKEEGSKNLNVYDYIKFDQRGNWTQCLKECLDMKKDKKKLYEKFSQRTIEYYAPPRKGE